MIKREEINLKETIDEFISKMSEGDLEAKKILELMLDAKPEGMGLLRILTMDDMNIRGFQISYGYKNYCQEDLYSFMDSIGGLDEKLVNAVNIATAKWGKEKPKAVLFNAVNNRQEMTDDEVKVLKRCEIIKKDGVKVL